MRWLVVLALAGCYSPSIAPCHLACAANDRCPDGLACNGEGLCAETASAVCAGRPDGGGPDSDIDAPPCGWPQISNVSPCALDANAASLDVDFGANTGTVHMINTDTYMTDIPGLTLMRVDLLGVANRPAAVAVVNLWHQRGGRLDVVGKLPLVIVANSDVLIEGQVVVAPQNDDVTCPNRGSDGQTRIDNNGGGGGGGGSFGPDSAMRGGSNGGRGGMHAPTNNPGEPGVGGSLMLQVGADLRPLRGGCPGGIGGSAGPDEVMGGPGGFGGGSIQISSRTSIGVTGSIEASGGGGGKGSVGPVTAPTGISGGGGGGAGGGILLEAPSIDLTSGRLCANGGGGGGTLTSGLAGTCGNGGDGGSPSAQTDGPGGRGGSATTTSSTGGMGIDRAGVSDPPAGGGGGGGGGTGRIRLNTTDLRPGIASPAPSLGSLPP